MRIAPNLIADDFHGNDDASLRLLPRERRLS